MTYIPSLRALPPQTPDAANCAGSGLRVSPLDRHAPYRSMSPSMPRRFPPVQMRSYSFHHRIRLRMLTLKPGPSALRASRATSSARLRSDVPSDRR